MQQVQSCYTKPVIMVPAFAFHGIAVCVTHFGVPVSWQQQYCGSVSLGSDKENCMPGDAPVFHQPEPAGQKKSRINRDIYL